MNAHPQAANTAVEPPAPDVRVAPGQGQSPTRLKRRPGSLGSRLTRSRSGRRDAKTHRTIVREGLDKPYLLTRAQVEAILAHFGLEQQNEQRALAMLLVQRYGKPRLDSEHGTKSAQYDNEAEIMIEDADLAKGLLLLGASDKLQHPEEHLEQQRLVQERLRRAAAISGVHPSPSPRTSHAASANDSVLDDSLMQDSTLASPAQSAAVNTHDQPNTGNEDDDEDGWTDEDDGVEVEVDPTELSDSIGQLPDIATLTISRTQSSSSLSRGSSLRRLGSLRKQSPKAVIGDVTTLGHRMSQQSDTSDGSTVPQQGELKAPSAAISRSGSLATFPSEMLPSTVTELQADLKSLMTTNAGLQTTLELKETEFRQRLLEYQDAAQLQIDELDEVLTNTRSEMLRVQRLHKQARAEIEDLKEQASRASHAQHRAERRATDEESRVVELAARVRSLEREAGELRQQNATLNAGLTLYKQRLTTAEEALLRHGEEHASSSSHSAQLIQELMEEVQELRPLREEVDFLRQCNEELREQVQAAALSEGYSAAGESFPMSFSDELAMSAAATNVPPKAEVACQTQEDDDTQLHAVAHSNMVAVMEQMQTAHKQELDNLRHSLETKLSAKSRQLQDRRQLVEQQASLIDKLKSPLLDMTSALQQLQIKNANLSRQILEQKRSLAKQQEELSTIRARNTALSGSLRRSSGSVSVGSSRAGQSDQDYRAATTSSAGMEALERSNKAMAAELRQSKERQVVVDQHLSSICHFVQEHALRRQELLRSMLPESPKKINNLHKARRDDAAGFVRRLLEELERNYEDASRHLQRYIRQLEKKLRLRDSTLVRKDQTIDSLKRLLLDSDARLSHAAASSSSKLARPQTSRMRNLPVNTSQSNTSQTAGPTQEQQASEEEAELASSQFRNRAATYGGVTNRKSLKLGGAGGLRKSRRSKSSRSPSPRPGGSGRASPTPPSHSKLMASLKAPLPVAVNGSDRPLSYMKAVDISDSESDGSSTPVSLSSRLVPGAQETRSSPLAQGGPPPSLGVATTPAQESNTKEAQSATDTALGLQDESKDESDECKEAAEHDKVINSDPSEAQMPLPDTGPPSVVPSKASSFSPVEVTTPSAHDKRLRSVGAKETLRTRDWRTSGGATSARSQRARTRSPATSGPRGQQQVDAPPQVAASGVVTEEARPRTRSLISRLFAPGTRKRSEDQAVGGLGVAKPSRPSPLALSSAETDASVPKKQHKKKRRFGFGKGRNASSPKGKESPVPPASPTGAGATNVLEPSRLKSALTVEGGKPLSRAALSGSGSGGGTGGSNGAGTTGRPKMIRSRSVRRTARHSSVHAPVLTAKHRHSPVLVLRRNRMGSSATSSAQGSQNSLVRPSSAASSTSMSRMSSREVIRLSSRASSVASFRRALSKPFDGASRANTKTKKSSSSSYESVDEESWDMDPDVVVDDGGDMNDMNAASSDAGSDGTLIGGSKSAAGVGGVSKVSTMIGPAGRAIAAATASQSGRKSSTTLMNKLATAEKTTKL